MFRVIIVALQIQVNGTIIHQKVITTPILVKAALSVMSSQALQFITTIMVSIIQNLITMALAQNGKRIVCIIGERA